MFKHVDISLNIFQEKDFVEPAKTIILQRTKSEVSVNDKTSLIEEKIAKSQEEFEKMNLKIEEKLNESQREIEKMNLKMEEILNILKNPKKSTR